VSERGGEKRVIELLGTVGEDRTSLDKKSFR
jgi:hypothetical protein